MTFQKNAWNALKSADDPEYEIDRAKSGELYFEHLRILTPDEYLEEEGWER